LSRVFRHYIVYVCALNQGQTTLQRDNTIVSRWRQYNGIWWECDFRVYAIITGRANHGYRQRIRVKRDIGLQVVVREVWRIGTLEALARRLKDDAGIILRSRILQVVNQKVRQVRTLKIFALTHCIRRVPSLVRQPRKR